MEEVFDRLLTAIEHHHGALHHPLFPPEGSERYKEVRKEFEAAFMDAVNRAVSQALTDAYRDALRERKAERHHAHSLGEYSSESLSVLAGMKRRGDV